MKTIFWCEFPEKVDWKKAKDLIKFKTEIYIAVKTRKEYDGWKKKIKSRNITLWAWPKLDEKEGYWFSGFIEKECIDRLKQFDGLKIKIDIEPPFPGKGFKPVKLLFTYFLPYLVKVGKNNVYLKETIMQLKSRIIISGFPLPGFITKRYGDIILLQENMEKNFISYTTLGFRILSRFYAKKFAKNAIKKYGEKAIFALGCTGKGIFGDEGTYKNINQFKEDFEMIKKTGAKKIVIFNLEGIMERENRKEWFDEIKRITFSE